MAQPHKHAEVIKQWADGEKIQYHDTKEWVDCPANPSFSSWIDYRVKPQTMRYRVALMKRLESNEPQVIQHEINQKVIESSFYFVRWLTDWIEVELG